MVASNGQTHIPGCPEMIECARLIHSVLSAVQVQSATQYTLPDHVRCEVRGKILKLCGAFPIPGYGRPRLAAPIAWCMSAGQRCRHCRSSTATITRSRLRRTPRACRVAQGARCSRQQRDARSTNPLCAAFTTSLAGDAATPMCARCLSYSRAPAICHQAEKPSIRYESPPPLWRLIDSAANELIKLSDTSDVSGRASSAGLDSLISGQGHNPRVRPAKLRVNLVGQGDTYFLFSIGLPAISSSCAFSTANSARKMHRAGPHRGPISPACSVRGSDIDAGAVGLDTLTHIRPPTSTRRSAPTQAVAPRTSPERQPLAGMLQPQGQKLAP